MVVHGQAPHLLCYGSWQRSTSCRTVAPQYPSAIFGGVVQELIKSATGREQSLTGWQKQLLLQARLIGDSANRGITVGKGSAASGKLPMGVDARLIMAARILCSPSPEAAQGSGQDSKASRSTAAALVLIHQYLRLLFSGLGLDAIRDQVSNFTFLILPARHLIRRCRCSPWHEQTHFQKWFTLQARMSRPGLPADFKTAAQLRLYKALLCEEVLLKVQTAATDACNDIDGDDSLTLKDLLSS